LRCSLSSCHFCMKWHLVSISLLLIWCHIWSVDTLIKETSKTFQYYCQSYSPGRLTLSTLSNIRLAYLQSTPNPTSTMKFCFHDRRMLSFQAELYSWGNICWLITHRQIHSICASWCGRYHYLWTGPIMEYRVGDWVTMNICAFSFSIISHSCILNTLKIIKFRLRNRKVY
jgi:hypothetical protein